MWDAADRAAFIDPDLPAYTLAVKGSGGTLGGHFRQPYAEAFGLVSGSSPTFQCDVASTPVRGETLTLDGTLYVVASVKPDGKGFAMLELDKQ